MELLPLVILNFFLIFLFHFLCFFFTNDLRKRMHEITDRDRKELKEKIYDLEREISNLKLNNRNK